MKSVFFFFFFLVVIFIGVTSNLSFTPKNLKSTVKFLCSTHQIGGVVNCSFVKLGSQEFLGISITSLLVSICISKSKLLILTFSIMYFFSLFFVCILVFVFY